MIDIPNSPAELNRQFGLFIIVMLFWAWAIAFGLVIAWRAAICWKQGRRQFSLAQTFMAVTIVALSVGLAVALTTMFRY